MSRFVLSLAALFVLACATPAFAQPARSASVAVAHADLDLHREPGARVMLRQLERAAERVCGVDRYDRRLDVKVAMRSCAAEALREAVARLDAPMVARLYRRGDAAIVVASTR